MKNYIHNYKRFINLNENVQEWNKKLNHFSWIGNIDGVKRYLKHGADVNCKSNNGWTPLMESSYRGHLEIVKLLIENGADVNCKGVKGWTPLMLSSNNGFLEVVKVLIENGADWNIKDDDNGDFMDYLSNREKNKEIIIREYPEEYKEYLFKKDVEKHNF